MSDLDRAAKRTLALTCEDMEHMTPFQFLASAISEMGEYAEALSIEEKQFGKRHRHNEESAKMEAIDLIISGLALYYSRGGKREDIAWKINKKLDKWEYNQSRSGGHCPDEACPGVIETSGQCSHCGEYDEPTQSNTTPRTLLQQIMDDTSELTSEELYELGKHLSNRFPEMLLIPETANAEDS